MRILALDSSGLVAGVAVLESENEKKDAQTIAEYTVNYKKTHSQTLLPMLDEIVKMTELDLDTNRCNCNRERTWPHLPDFVSVQQLQKDWDLHLRSRW